MSLLVGSLFYLLSPGILLRFPKNGSKMTVAATHAAIFAIIYYFLHNFMWNSFHEGFKELNPPTAVPLSKAERARLEEEAKQAALAEQLAKKRGEVSAPAVSQKGAAAAAPAIVSKKMGFTDFY